MSVQLSACAGANLRSGLLPAAPWRGGRRPRCSAAAAGRDGGSYLDIWKKAMERESRALASLRIAAEVGEGGSVEPSLEAKTEHFKKLLQVPTEERDRIQRLQVIDRAAAAIAAARALLDKAPRPAASEPPDASPTQLGLQQEHSVFYQSDTAQNGSPGPDFWSWSPPSDSVSEPIGDGTGLKSARKQISQPHPSHFVMEMEKSTEFLAIPLESKLSEAEHNPPLPPLQSLVEVDKLETSTTEELSTAAEEEKVDQLFSRNAAEAAEALGKSNEESDHGVNPDGSKWWRETGIEQRPDGVTCKWTLTRGVSADGTVEWEDKFWEAADEHEYKELGSEKSGRDAVGNVWREFWKESMWLDARNGLTQMEKTADKWGKNVEGEEWQEKWWEHYDASGQAEKWAHKWCCIDPRTPLRAGHAHVWHERWGEKYDGRGGSMKYTDKWAERWEGDGWSKWGDKWDEHFDRNGHGVKQGETWWEGRHGGERWNRTWGEQHNGTGWVHKYGKSSSGEHWDTHVQQETWRETHPHYGFDHCFQNSLQLRAVRRPIDDDDTP
ncbi:hypothetical protein OPV22_013508 [Ensete ventricosum]|uniref:Uncharacterized protein n=1 Tax=Ensete ventricosum TaxID=4639 RepID=A0AAV8R9E4_ENSVE|nr:hypothetical protein OPV22_013508 [Ensete ventricosum]